VGDILARVRERATEIPAGEWVVAEGYDERWLVEGRAPTLAELDAACPNHPVLLVHFSYHEVVVNTHAPEKMGLRLHRFDPPGREIEPDRRGWPTGRMIENAAAPFYMGAIRALRYAR